MGDVVNLRTGQLIAPEDPVTAAPVDLRDLLQDFDPTQEGYLFVRYRWVDAGLMPAVQIVSSRASLPHVKDALALPAIFMALSNEWECL